MDESLHQMLWFGLTLVIVITLFKANASKRNHKELADENERKVNALKSKPVSVIVDELKQSCQNIEAQIASGMPAYNQVNDLLKKNKGQLKYINVGLLPPIFKFDDRESLKNQINACQEQQFKVINQKKATTAYTNWDWFGSKSDGSRMVNAYQDHLLKAFNAEFDVIRKQMRHATFDTSKKKLYRLGEQLEKLGETANVTISREYFKLKLAELCIWREELVHNEELKQEKKEQQALLRQQAKQIGDETEEIEDDIYYRKSDLQKAKKLAAQLHGASATDMQLKIKRMQAEIEKLESKFERATSQAQITKAGYIYVISNIGSFGEGIVKIGMTRRLEPMDRVVELGDASVPFRFDVHTLTFVDDAPRIEKALHRKFNDKRVNVDNNRKEFFKVTPQEVATTIEEMGINADWFFDIEAKEFRESLLMREAINKETAQVQTVSHELPTAI